MKRIFTLLLVSTMLCSSDVEDVVIVINNEKKQVLPGLEVRTRRFEDWEMLEIFYQSKIVHSVSIEETQYYSETRPNAPIFISRTWRKDEEYPSLRILLPNGDEIFLHRRGELSWRAVTDPVRMILSDEDYLKRRDATK